jgi:indolepyruvate decarboxylase
VHHGINPIVVIADNGGYGTQRPMLDGPFNDVPSLAAEHLPAVFGTGQGFLCDTESELHEALKKSVATDTLSIIRARIPKGKYSPALIRLTDALRKKI